MEQVKLAIIGAGPAGIATAVEAKEANISPVMVLEKKGHICDTIESLYPAGKRVDPVHRKVKVEPIGKLSFNTETREAFLDRMKKVVKESDLDIRYWNEAQNVTQYEGNFRIRTGGGLEVQTPIVVMAIGIFGKPVKPRYPIPKAVRGKIYYSLPETPIKKRKVLVVGGGDTAAEIACFLAEHNDVILSYRRPEFFRLNEINIYNINECVRKGTINTMMATDIEGLESQGDNKVLVNFKDGRNIDFDAVFYCLGGMTPKKFLEKIRIKFDRNKAVTDEYGETNIPRLFLAGDLVAQKGTIMAAFNSGKKVIDGILARYGDLLKN
jgi:thioredoxin reductase (NADPH)